MSRKLLFISNQFALIFNIVMSANVLRESTHKYRVHMDVTCALTSEEYEALVYTYTDGWDVLQAQTKCYIF